MRAERLEVIASLKAAQVYQSLSTYFYQAYLLSTRDQTSLALTRYRAGNTTADNWSIVNSYFNSTFSASQSITAIAIFDITGTLAYFTSVDPIGRFEDALFPAMNGNSSILSSLRDESAIISGPLYNSYDSRYLFSFTFPIMSNTTIFLDFTQLSGYMSVVFQTGGFQSIINDTTGLDDNGMMYLLSANNGTGSESNNIMVQALLPATNLQETIPGIYPLSEVSAVDTAVTSNRPGSIINSYFFSKNKVSVGYALCAAFSGLWVIIITEPHSTVYSPIYRLRNITLISGFAVLFCCTLVIVVCVHFGVQPIYSLKQAAEQTTLSFHDSNNSNDSGNGPLKSDPPHQHKSSNSVQEKHLPPTHKFSFLKSRISSSSFWNFLSKSQTLHDKSSEISPPQTPTIGSFRSSISLPPENESCSPATAVNQSASSSDRTQHHSPSNVAILASSSMATGINMSQLDLAHGNNQSKVQASNELVIKNKEGPGNQSSPRTPEISPTDEITPRRRMLIPARVKMRENRFFTDELMSLEYSFNRMADELEKQYTHLEDMVRDRTKELEAARVQAENANEAKSLFIANITHELRTPLNGILGMTAVSLTENDPAKVMRSLKVISKSGVLLLNLLNDLLTFSKNQIGNISIEEKEFVLGEIVTQLKSIYTKQANDKNISLEYDVSPPTAKEMVLFGDSGRILNVLFHLISNSMKFTPKDGKIQVLIKCLQICDQSISSDDESNTNISGYTTAPSSRANTADCVPSTSVEGDVTTDQDSMHMLSLVTSPMSMSEKSPPNSFPIPDGTNNSDDSMALTSFPSNINSSNSADHSSTFQTPKSNFEVLSEPRPCIFRFEVQDNGPGVDPSRLEQLFEPFVQGDQALSRRHGGAGLGLSICKQLVSLMGGTIMLRNTDASESHGGLVVTVDLPLKQTRVLLSDHLEEQYYSLNGRSRHNSVQSEKVSLERQPSMSIPICTTESVTAMLGNQAVPKQKDVSNGESYFEYRPKFKKKHSSSTIHLSKLSTPQSLVVHGDVSSPHEIRAHVLVAEDNMINQEIMKRMLGLEGIRDVELAFNGKQAVVKIEDAIRRGIHYDIVFMDVQMPTMDGLQAASIIRTELGYGYPIVALTAFAEEENVQQCLAAGMDSFMEKPIMRKSLREVLVKYCPVGSLNEALPSVSNFESMLNSPGSPSTPM